MGEMVMLTIDASACARPSIEWAAEQMSLPIDAFDEGFGIIVVDPVRNIYTVRVDSEKLPPDLPKETGLSGPFSDPKIVPFGNPTSE
ncbi:MAG: hypothetical protein GDA39_10135 [Hyphomonadaceae bacterium]|nr:hypothetical protein [Hyphomonadaceae bacterium]MBC6413191.1 hypothetical protein [Hyphomonadaceae bacterium]